MRLTIHDTKRINRIGCQLAAVFVVLTSVLMVIGLKLNIWPLVFSGCFFTLAHCFIIIHLEEKAKKNPTKKWLNGNYLMDENNPFFNH